MFVNFCASGQDFYNFFNPNNYLDRLPSLALPYVSSVPIPSHKVAQIKPTPVVTKVVSVVTKYLFKNPVCLKVNGNKPPCKLNRRKTNTGLEYLVTKEYFVRDPVVKSKEHGMRRGKVLDEGFPVENSDAGYSQEESVGHFFGKIDGSDEIETKRVKRSGQIEGSEIPLLISRTAKTPNLLPSKVQELLIEDRLDQLEDILPHYTRRRVYETSTITVTKTRRSNRATATLLVKNCVPKDIDLCPTSQKKSLENQNTLGQFPYG